MSRRTRPSGTGWRCSVGATDSRARRRTSSSTSTSARRLTCPSYGPRLQTPRWSRGCRLWWREPVRSSPGPRRPRLRMVSRFFVETFPAAVWRVPLVGGQRRRRPSSRSVSRLGWWVAAHPHVQSAIASPEQIRQLVDHDFQDYYSVAPLQGLRLPGVDQQRLGHGAVHRVRRVPRPARDLAAVRERRERRPSTAD